MRATKHRCLSGCLLIPMLSLCGCAGSGAGEAAAAVTRPVTADPSGDLQPMQLEVEPVWSAHPVGFSLLTHGGMQFAAYYDAERRMSVAQRRLDERRWTITKLPSQVKWDSHNYVTMAFDNDDYLHLSGNMHCVPLIYFKAAKPLDATSLERVANMVEPATERRVTYPRFIHGPEGMFVFRYRDGSSGRGNDIYNVYDHAAKGWRRLLAHPLTDGRGQMNGYFSTPVPGPDGYFHMYGVWRDTPDCATNHHLSYARSRDLVQWEKGDGTPLTTPLTVDNIDIVDPIPPKGGLLNGNPRLSFDSRQRPVLCYHKYAPDGGSQVFCARFEDGKWRIYQTTAWEDYRWDFSGGGCIPNVDVRQGPITLEPDGTLNMAIHSKAGGGTWRLDEATLKPVGRAAPKPAPMTPPAYSKLQSTFPGMRKNRAWSTGNGDDPRVRYVLSWETLGANRDRPRQPPLPEPSMLTLCTVIQPAAE
jgi:hypothetical protein